MVLNKIAVYGTLRYGAKMNDLMRGCTYLGKDLVKGKLYRVGGFPGLKPLEEKEEGSVVVDVYELPEDVNERLAKMVSLDRYEGYHEGHRDQSLFVRTNTTTESGDHDVMVYEYLHPCNDQIASGDWLNDQK